MVASAPLSLLVLAQPCLGSFSPARKLISHLCLRVPCLEFLILTHILVCWRTFSRVFLRQRTKVAGVSAHTYLRLFRWILSGCDYF